MREATLSEPEKKVPQPLFFGDRTLGGCGPLLRQKLLEVLPLCSQPTGGGSSKHVFPLPTSSSVLVATYPSLTPNVLSWLLCVNMSLNSLWGGFLFSDKMPNTVQKQCLDALLKDVTRFCEIQANVEDVAWSEFFRIKAIDYKGDEVRVARWFSWANIKPALPVEIGRVPLEEVCSKGCRHYVENFDLYLRPPEEWDKFKAPRVMVHDGDWNDVCNGLVQSGVCEYILEEDVFMTPCGRLLNGLFGVTKDDFTSDHVEIYRLIMNLIPLNGLCQRHASLLEWYEPIFFATITGPSRQQRGCQVFLLHYENSAMLDEIPGF